MRRSRGHFASRDPTTRLLCLICNVRSHSACRRAEDGEVAAPGERIQSPAHAPEPHAVHAARRASRCRTHRHPVTSQSAASPAGAGTGSRRAGPQGQPEYDQHGSPRKVSPSFLLFSFFISPRLTTMSPLSRERPRYFGSCATSQRETFSLTCTLRALRVRDKNFASNEIGSAKRDAATSKEKLRVFLLKFKHSELTSISVLPARTNWWVIWKLDLSVSSFLRRALWPARPKEYDFKRIGRDGEAVEIQGVSTPLDLFLLLAPLLPLPPAPSFIFASSFDFVCLDARRSFDSYHVSRAHFHALSR